MGELKAFAEVEELEKVFRPLEGEERTKAEALLLQASNTLRMIAFNNKKDLDAMMEADTSGVFKANVKAVVIAAVQRMMTRPSEMAPDATAWSQSASPYSESMSFSAESSGSTFFKRRELQLLGLGSISGGKQIGILRGVR